MNRRDFLNSLARYGALGTLGALLGGAVFARHREGEAYSCCPGGSCGSCDLSGQCPVQQKAVPTTTTQTKPDIKRD